MITKRFYVGLRHRRVNLALTAALSLVLLSCNEVDVHPENSTLTLCQDYFEACINPILTQPLTTPSNPSSFSCASEGCHNVATGSGGSFKIYPRADPGSENIKANFFSAKSFANISDPALSKILLEPLAGVSSVAGPHGGGDIFLDPSDSRYQEIYLWISHPQESETEACPNLDWFPSDVSKRCNNDPASN